MGTALLILLLLALCGFIAYIGDLLGRRLGKKRLSLFGLRPKHTAIVLTIVTGVLIAGVTFGAALLTVPWFREAVTRGESLQADNQRLETQNTQRRNENAELLRESQAVAAENQRLQMANAKLETDNSRLGQENTRLSGANQKLTTQNSKLATENGNLRSTSERLERGNARLLRAQNQLAQQVGQLNSQVEGLREVSIQYRAGSYIFRKDQQICFRPVPPNPPAEVLTGLVGALVADVQEKFREEARQQGLPGARVPVVELASGDGRIPSSPALEPVRQWLLQEAKRPELRNKPLRVLVLAQENCVEGRPIPAVVHLYANDLVFRRGEEIARREVDGAASRGDILQQLLIVEARVRAAATEAPRSMPASDEVISKPSWDHLLDMAERVKSIGGRVTVVARAKRDTPRLGPLHFELEVRSVGRPAAFAQ